MFWVDELVDKVSKKIGNDKISKAVEKMIRNAVRTNVSDPQNPKGIVGKVTVFTPKPGRESKGHVVMDEVQSARLDEVNKKISAKNKKR